jgi:hypothetical protein
VQLKWGKFRVTATRWLHEMHLARILHAGEQNKENGMKRVQRDWERDEKYVPNFNHEIWFEEGTSEI